MAGTSLLVKALCNVAGEAKWSMLLRKPRLDDGTVMDKTDASGREIAYPNKHVVECGICFSKEESGISVQTWQRGFGVFGSDTARPHIIVLLNADATEVVHGSLDDTCYGGGMVYHFGKEDATAVQRARWLELVSTALITDLNTIKDFQWDIVK